MNKELIFILQQIRYVVHKNDFEDPCLKDQWKMHEFKCNSACAKKCECCPICRNIPTRYSEQLIFSIEVSDEPRVNTNS